MHGLLLSTLPEGTSQYSSGVKVETIARFLDYLTSASVPGILWG